VRFPGATHPVVHCRNQRQAEEVMQSIALRLAECGLTMHPDKSKVVYCKDDSGRPLPCDLQHIAKAVIVEAAHSVEVGGQRIAAPCL
jgi:hypothetical protein